MSTPESFSLIRRLSQMATVLNTALFGKEVGRDQFGNRYFEERGKLRPCYGGRVRLKRWVLFKGEPEPTKVPPEWHVWLHYSADAPLLASDRKSWQKPHVANMTGTPEAWMPPSLRDSAAPQALNAYSAWKPD